MGVRRLANRTINFSSGNKGAVMSINIRRIERYYDTHDVEGEEVSQTTIHAEVIRYLIAVLEWFLQERSVKMVSEFSFYQDPDDPQEVPITPDVAVVENPPENIDEIASYTIREDGPSPSIVFEVSSQKTWKKDVETKPADYAGLGVKEYFVFDPHKKQVWNKEWRKHGRIVGWRLNALGKMEPIPKEANGWLWSEQLESFIGVEDARPRLYDRTGNVRLTEAQARAIAEERERRGRIDAELKAENEKRLKFDVELKSRELEQRAKNAELKAEAERRLKAEAEQRAIDAELRAKELLEKLKQLDPNFKEDL